MSVHGDDDLYADLYGNDDYDAVESEILGETSTPAEKTNISPAEPPRTSNTTEPAPSKPAVQAQPAAVAPFKPAEFAPEPVRTVPAPAPAPQIGSSIATYTSDEGTTLPPTSYNNGYGSLPPSMRPYDPGAEKQPGPFAKSNPASNFSETNQGGIQANGYNDQSDGNSYQQKQGGYANGAVFESSNQGGYGGAQRGGYGGFNAGGGQAGGRRFDSVRPSEMKDEG